MTRYPVCYPISEQLYSLQDFIPIKFGREAGPGVVFPFLSGPSFLLMGRESRGEKEGGIEWQSERKTRVLSL